MISRAYKGSHNLCGRRTDVTQHRIGDIAENYHPRAVALWLASVWRASHSPSFRLSLSSSHARFSPGKRFFS